MRLCRFNSEHLGVWLDGEIADVTPVLDSLPRFFWARGLADPVMENLGDIRGRIDAILADAPRLSVDEVTLDAPVAMPSKIIGAPVNYQAHIDESHVDESLHQGGKIFPIDEIGCFLKAASGLTGHGATIVPPAGAERVDHEAEVAVIIGKAAKEVKAADALAYVAGYSLAYDMTVRGKQDRSMRKSCDGFAVLGPTLVTADEIAGIVSRWTGIPVDKMMEGEREKLLDMENILGKRVIGQEQAIVAVSKAVRRARAGLQDPGRPLGSFLFLGPTGVGKTELTKALAGFLFDDDQAMVRIDMSEFMEKHSVARLIGAPPGYVGYDEGGVLTEAVRRRPYQVVLFDEVEKAHTDVFNVLLQVLDDGHLTDGQGRKVDFSNTLIILTSNLGSQYLSNLPDDGKVADVEDQVMDVVRGHFRPEFLNRLDEIILFHRLAMEHMAPIVEIQVKRVQKLLDERKITLDLTDAALRWLGRVGYDPVYGARPLKRAVQRYLQDPLAEKLIEGKIPDGSTLKIDEGDGELKMEIA